MRASFRSIIAHCFAVRQHGKSEEARANLRLNQGLALASLLTDAPTMPSIIPKYFADADIDVLANDYTVPMELYEVNQNTLDHLP